MAIDRSATCRARRAFGLGWYGGIALIGSIGLGIVGRAYVERNGLNVW